MLLWALGAEGSLSDRARLHIAETADEVLVSAATIWELGIKRSLGRLRVDADLVEYSERSGFAELPVSFAHATASERLPRLHSDPFDRMLIAQAQVEGLTIATADSQIARYDVPVLAADG